jgi:hypothetical protein
MGHTRRTVVECFFKNGDFERMKVFYRHVRPEKDVTKEIKELFTLDRKRWLETRQRFDAGKPRKSDIKWLFSQVEKWL